jgi:hypothetical protein
MGIKLPDKLKKLPRRLVYISLVLVLMLGTFYWRSGRSGATTTTFATSGSWTVPAGVSSATFEAWGGGGGGGACAVACGGGGGAGGQYAINTVSVTPGDIHTVTVATAGTAAAAGSAGFPGGDSSVLSPLSTTEVLAKGGPGGDGVSTGVGGTGSTTSGVGSTVFAGGNGGNGSGGTGGTGGGGGGGAGSTGGGGNASGITAGTGTSTNGGNGSSGGTGNFVGTAGNNYGGGGSGASRNNGSSKNGGAGAQGLVTVTYTVVANSPPNTPTIISPSSGSTVGSVTPQIQLSATDPEGNAVKFKLFVYDTTATLASDCSGSNFDTGDQTVSGTGWDNGTTAYASGATATYTVQTTLTRGNGYCFQAAAIDPAGSNTVGNANLAVTFTVNSTPDAPTLITPASAATGVSVTPSFTLRTTDADNDYLRYRIYLFQSNCTTPVGTSPFDQNSSQTGWSGQDANTSTAYVGNSTITSSTIATYTYQGTLTAGTTYCWQADATDPAGSNTFSSTSSTQSFTTAAAGSSVTIGGGVTIQGGTTIQ